MPLSRWWLVRCRSVGVTDRAIGDAVPVTRAGPAVYLVATDDGHDPVYVATRAASLQLAGATGSRVVLYDPSSESSWTHPYDPNICSSGAGRGQLLGPQVLRRLGYGYLADQLEQARAMGLDAEAALAWGRSRRDGPDEVLRELHVLSNAIGPKAVGVGGDGQGAELLGREGRRGPGGPVRFGSVPSGSAPGAALSGRAGPAIAMAARSSPSSAWLPVVTLS
jgi:hypothetical protein